MALEMKHQTESLALENTSLEVKNNRDGSVCFKTKSHFLTRLGQRNTIYLISVLFIIYNIAIRD